MQFFEQVRDIVDLAMRTLFLHVGESPVPDFPQENSRPGGHIMSRPEDVFHPTGHASWGKLLVLVIIVVLAVIFVPRLMKAQTTTQQTRNTDSTIAALNAKIDRITEAASNLSAQLARTKAMLEARQPDNPAMRNAVVFEAFPACVAEMAQFLPPRQAADRCLDTQRIERNGATDASRAQRPVFSNAGLYGGGLYGGGGDPGVAFVPASQSLRTPAYAYPTHP